jgi:DUF4097 and DUF4098 domain-containing protein YvlB
MHHRRSLFAPIVLILFGALLLARNFRPEFPFWEIVGRYWPVVLIVWGLAKLSGALRRPAPGQPAWRPSLTVGEFFLALFIVLVGLSATRWVEARGSYPWWQADFDWPWTQHYSFTEDVKQPMPAQSALYVENYAGDVHVTGADTNEVTASITKQVRAEAEAQAKTLADRLHAALVQEGDTLTFRMPTDPALRADVVLTVPKATPVRFEVRRGSIQAADLVGDLNAQVDRGDVQVSNIQGNVRVQLSRSGSLNARNIKGNVELEGNGNDVQVSDVTGQLSVRGNYSGASDYSRIAQGVRFNSTRTDMEIQKLPGSLQMTIGSLTITQPSGPVTVNTRKDIRIEDFDEKIQVVDHNASVELSTTRLPLRDIVVENHSGPIEVSIPAGSEFQVEARAQRGEVESDFNALQVNRGTDEGQIRGTVGRGLANLKLTTSYGSIRLRQLGSRPGGVRPPAPPKPPPPPRISRGAERAMSRAIERQELAIERTRRATELARNRLEEARRQTTLRIARPQKPATLVQ